MEPLKEMFNQQFYQALAEEFSKVDKTFKTKSFILEVTKDLSSLELNQRLRRTSETLKNFLPSDYEKSISLMRKVIPNLKTGYTNLVFPDFVGLYGRHDIPFSLNALKHFTCFGSSEFAIREYLRQDFDATIREMYTWASDKNHHVRRLASEGSRPRLPWSFKLDRVIENPELTLPILEKLKADNELYVRKSVANHLNDISKEHPDKVISIIKKWKGYSPYTDWILKHGSRTLLKKGHSGVLGHFGIIHSDSIETSEFRIQKNKIKVGDSLHFFFTLHNRGSKPLKVRVEYALYFRVISGNLSKKVFKISEREMYKAQTLSFERKHSFKLMTTRKYNAGIHKVALIINGKEGEPFEFNLNQ